MRKAPLATPDLPAAESVPAPPVEVIGEAAPEPEADSAAVAVDAAEEAPAGDGAEIGAGDPLTRSPLDELAAIEVDPNPKKLAEERDRVTHEPPTFDIPVVVNDRVLAWVDLYSGRMKDSFQAALDRSGRYLGMFRRIFREEGLPEDLVYMAHVESGYKTSAYSRAHARGIFQFIAGTARRYGLRVDYWVDERADPEKAARAAASYLKDLHAEFGDWYLVLAAYNAGEGKIRSAIARSGRRDFWGIARTAHIRRETKNHVPAILAATLISKEPEKYGLFAQPESPLVYDVMPVDGAADLRVLARCASTDVETLRQLNPALRRLQTPPDGRTEVRLPAGSAAVTAQALALIPTRERVLYARHRVQRGDTLSTIARSHSVPVAAIQQANHLGRKTLIRVNQVLLIPTSSASRYTEPAAPAAPEEVAEIAGTAVVSHRVRKGDTLSSLSRRYGTTPASIAAASGRAVGETLSIGERLTIVRGVSEPQLARSLALGGPAEAAAADGGTPQHHMVQSGDTLWSIASLYRTSVAALCALNRISPGAVIRPGTRLTVAFN